jgi:hypothetical protein
MAPKPSGPSSQKSPPISPPTSPPQRPQNITSPPPSPPQNPTKARNSSVASASRREQYYTPYQPSSLRNSIVPEGSPTRNPQEGTPLYYDQRSGGNEREEHGNEDEWLAGDQQNNGESSFYNDPDPDENTGLLAVDGPKSPGQGTFPRRTFVRPGLHRNYDSFTSLMSDGGFGGGYPGAEGSVRSSEGVLAENLGDAVMDGILADGSGSKLSTTAWLRKKHGIKGKRTMCVHFSALRVALCPRLKLISV